jgi:hypothetical protein
MAIRDVKCRVQCAPYARCDAKCGAQCTPYNFVILSEAKDLVVPRSFASLRMTWVLFERIPGHQLS